MEIKKEETEEEFWIRAKKQLDQEYKEAKKKNPHAKRDKSLNPIENKERNYRRNELKFTQIQGDKNDGYVDNYIYKNTKNDKRDEFNKTITTKAMYRSLYTFSGMDRELLIGYMKNEKKKDMAEKYNISPSAVTQRLNVLLEDYRVVLCNDKDFRKTREFCSLKWESKNAFKKYIEDLRKSGTFKIDLDQVQEFIKEVKTTIRRTIETSADINIKQKLSKQIDYSNLDDKYIEDMNNAFAELGIEAHFEKLKLFKGNVIQILKMVDDFISNIKKQTL